MHYSNDNIFSSGTVFQLTIPITILSLILAVDYSVNGEPLYNIILRICIQSLRKII